MRGISSLATKPVSFSRRTLLHGVRTRKKPFLACWWLAVAARENRLPKQNMSFLIYRFIFHYFFHYNSLSPLSNTLLLILFCVSFIFRYLLFFSAVLFFSLSPAILLLHLYFSLLLSNFPRLSFPPLNLFASLKSIYSNSPLSSYPSLFIRFLHYFSFLFLYMFVYTFPFSSITSFFLNSLPSRQTSRLLTVNRKAQDNRYSFLKGDVFNAKLCKLILKSQNYVLPLCINVCLFYLFPGWFKSWGLFHGCRQLDEFLFTL